MKGKRNKSTQPRMGSSRQSSNRFYLTLTIISLVGIVAAFSVPRLIFDSQDGNNSISESRQMILYIVGCILALLTLRQTHREYSATLKEEKKEKDYLHRLRVERHSSYTTAKKQLFDANSCIRLGGIYVLLGIVDQILIEDSFTEEREKEIQDIIDTLCKYIRSIPINYTIQDLRNGVYPNDEQDIRTTILKEIGRRMEGHTETQWSNFKYDFSNTFFFYPANFSKYNFNHSVSFANSIFAETANFTGAKFNKDVNFAGAKFNKEVDFTEAKFYQREIFSRVEFFKEPKFDATLFAKSPRVFVYTNNTRKDKSKGRFEVVYEPSKARNVEAKEAKRNRLHIFTADSKSDDRTRLITRTVPHDPDTLGRVEVELHPHQ